MIDINKIVVGSIIRCGFWTGTKNNQIPELFIVIEKQEQRFKVLLQTTGCIEHCFPVNRPERWTLIR